MSEIDGLTTSGLQLTQLKRVLAMPAKCTRCAFLLSLPIFTEHALAAGNASAVCLHTPAGAAAISAVCVHSLGCRRPAALLASPGSAGHLLSAHTVTVHAHNAPVVLLLAHLL